MYGKSNGNGTLGKVVDAKKQKQKQTVAAILRGSYRRYSRDSETDSAVKSVLGAGAKRKP